MKLPLLLAAAASLAIVPHAAAAQIILTSASVHEQHAQPGDEYTTQIELANPSAIAQRVRIYQTDHFAFADGRVAYPHPGTTKRSNARWISAGPAEVVVPPSGKTTVRVRVRVPAEPGLSGTYWSMVMIEGSGDDSEASGSRRNVGVRTVLRLGVQLATHVGGPADVRIAFDSVRASSVEGHRRLSYDFLNTGVQAARLLMSLELFDGAGRVVRKLEQQRGLLYPGNSARQSFDLGLLPAGAYTAVVTADGGADEVFGAQYTVRF